MQQIFLVVLATPDLDGCGSSWLVLNKVSAPYRQCILLTRLLYKALGTFGLGPGQPCMSRCRKLWPLKLANSKKTSIKHSIGFHARPTCVISTFYFFGFVSDSVNQKEVWPNRYGWTVELYNIKNEVSNIKFDGFALNVRQDG